LRFCDVVAIDFFEAISANKETLAFYRSETTLSDHVLRGRGLPVARLFIVQLGLPNDLLGAAR
jgi:hypothetical protein